MGALRSRRGRSGHRPRRGTPTALLAASAASLVLAGCELEEVTIVDPEDVVVVEAHVQAGERITAFLHRTLTSEGTSMPVPGATVTVRGSDGTTLELAETDIDRCVVTTPIDGTGTCHFANPLAAGIVHPGDTLSLRVDLPDGGVLESQAVVPGAFEIVGIGEACSLPSDTPLDVRWTRADGAWAYVNETLLQRVEEAFGARGISVDPEDDPLYLLGLSVSAADTTIVFPGEFGLFNRFELDQELAVALQTGLPPGIWADVTITAADRNYVNWVRGGNFNPSGQVRVPSVRGDGTGVFAASVVRGFRIFVTDAPSTAPPCP